MPDLDLRLAQAVARATAGTSDFDLNPDVSLPPGRKLRAAAVLVGVIGPAAAPRVILTKRASHLSHHPGQVAFPGGKLEPGDPTPAAAALREAEEEIALNPAASRIVGQLPPHETVTGFEVHPIVARVAEPFVPRPDPTEVDEVFEVPLAHLADPARYSVQSRRWRGTRRHYYTVPWGPYYIWGATARMLRQLAGALSQ